MRKPNTAIVEQIKDAARELLKGKEPSQIGMRDIAEKCGITAANIYHYYKDKDQLFSEICGSEGKSEPDKKRNDMKDITEMMNYRSSIKVVDATLRDGGLVNDFYFAPDFAKLLYEANVRAGVDYMEFGYKADKTQFDVNKFGPSKFCDDDYIRSIVGDGERKVKVAVMADVGRCDYKNDILPKSESVIDMIRVATYVHQMPAAIDIIEDCKAKGYEVVCNIMAISNAKEADLEQALEMVANSSADGIYIVDSYGSLYPEQIREIADKYTEIAEKNGKYVGMHAHNNQQLAFANTVEALTNGASLLDATVSGMGRGAGNCYMESLLAFLRNPRYNLVPVMDFVQKYIKEEKEKGSVWGYDIPYLLTGVMNSHPSSAIKFMDEKREDYSRFYQELLDNME